MNTVALLICFFLTPSQDDLIPVGQENWEKPWVPDLRKPEAKIPIAVDKRIDVLLLCDGYLASERADFEKEVRQWYDRFLTYTPWSQLRGAFRVRGLWTASEARATPERKSAYRLAATATGVGDVGHSRVAEAIFASLDKAGVNRTVTRSRMSHVVPVLLVRNEQSRNPSGLTRTVTSSDAKASVAVAFAAYTHHEFGHAFGGLRDEYISLTSEKTPPRSGGKPNLFTLSNVTSTRDPAQLAWVHLVPGGPLNPAKESVIGRHRRPLDRRRSGGRGLAFRGALPHERHSRQLGPAEDEARAQSPRPESILLLVRGTSGGPDAPEDRAAGQLRGRRGALEEVDGRVPAVVPQVVRRRGPPADEERRECQGEPRRGEALRAP
jgi:hypothetical protein